MAAQISKKNLFVVILVIFIEVSAGLILIDNIPDLQCFKDKDVFHFFSAKFSQGIALKMVSGDTLLVHCGTAYFRDSRCSSNALEKFLKSGNPTNLRVSGCMSQRPYFVEIINEVLTFFDSFSEMTWKKSLINDLTQEMISRQSNLTVFISNHCRFENNTLPGNFFRLNAKLRAVVLKDCHLNSLPEDLFSNLTELVRVEISENYLDSLESGLFVTNTQLESANLSNNNLQLISPLLLSRLTNLQVLDLSGNNFKYIPDNLLRNNSKLKRFLMLNDDCALQNEKKRIFPSKFLPNVNEFYYSTRSKLLSCEQIIFPTHFFINETSHLVHFSLTNANVDWLDLEPILSDRLSIDILDLSSNNIKRIRNVKTSFKSLKVDNNYLDCQDCQTLGFLVENQFLTNSTFCKNYDEVNSDQIYGVEEAFTYFCNQSHIIAIYVIGSVVVLLGIITVLVYTNRRVKVFLFNLKLIQAFLRRLGNKEFDAFVCYTDQDVDLAIELITRLESKSFRCWVPDRDWIPGSVEAQEISRSIENSRRTIVILSPDFINSDRYTSVFRSAFQCDSLLVIRCPNLVVEKGSEVEHYLKNFHYLTTTEPHFWEKLFSELENNFHR